MHRLVEQDRNEQTPATTLDWRHELMRAGGRGRRPARTVAEGKAAPAPAADAAANHTREG